MVDLGKGEAYKAAGEANRYSGAEKRNNCEIEISNINQRIAQLQDQIAKNKINIVSGKTALKETEKNTDIWEALNREIDRLNSENSNLEATLKNSKKRLAEKQSELKNYLKDYKESITQKLGFACAQAIQTSISTTVRDADSLYKYFSLELDRLENTYSADLVMDARKVMLPAKKLIKDLNQIIGKAV